MIKGCSSLPLVPPGHPAPGSFRARRNPSRTASRGNDPAQQNRRTVKITRSTALGLCALAIATAPACSTTESDVDTTAATSAESTTATDARVNRVGIDPCTLLTDAEAEDAVGFAPLTPTLGIDPDNPRASCDWRPADTSVEVLIGVAIGEMKYIPDHDASLTIPGVEVKFSPETRIRAWHSLGSTKGVDCSSGLSRPRRSALPPHSIPPTAGARRPPPPSKKIITRLG